MDLCAADTRKLIAADKRFDSGLSQDQSAGIISVDKDLLGEFCAKF